MYCNVSLKYGSFVLIRHCMHMQVHALISCLQAVKTKSQSILKTAPPPPQAKQAAAHSVGGAGRGGGADPASSIGASMYHSAVESLFGTHEEETAEGDGGVHSRETVGGGGGGEGGRRRTTSRQSSTNLAQRLLVASEKQISAKLSITEVLLSLSSRGTHACRHAIVTDKGPGLRDKDNLCTNAPIGPSFLKIGL